MQKESEKRNRIRVNYIISSTFIRGDETELVCSLHDISMSGAYLATDNPCAIGERGRLLIQLRCGDEDKTVNASCEVVRVISDTKGQNPAGMAVQITSIDTDSSIILFNMIRYQSDEDFTED